MDPGKRNKRISIMKKSPGKDSVNQPVETLVLVKKVWAKQYALSGREVIVAKQVESKIKLKFNIRYDKSIEPKMLIQSEGKTYKIEDISNPDGANKEMILYCQED